MRLRRQRRRSRRRPAADPKPTEGRAMRQNPTISLAASVILALAAGTLHAHDHSAHAGHGQPADPHAGHAQHAAAAPTASTVQVTLTDTALLDQNGLPRRIRSYVF